MPRWELADQTGNEYVYVDAQTGREMRVPINALEENVVSPVRFAGETYNKGPVINHSSGWTTGGGMAPRQAQWSQSQGLATAALSGAAGALAGVPQEDQPLFGEDMQRRFAPPPAQPPMPQYDDPIMHETLMQEFMVK